MKTIIFSPAAYNLAETTRCLEIAKACRNHFEILFISYGGEFENLIEHIGNIGDMNRRLALEEGKARGV